MSIGLSIDVANQVVYSKLSGEVSGAEILATQASLAAAPSFDPSFNALIEIQPNTRIQLLDAERRSLMRNSVFRVGIRRAFVIDDVTRLEHEGLLEALSGPVGAEIRFFFTRADAEQWLAPAKAG